MEKTELVALVLVLLVGLTGAVVMFKAEPTGQAIGAYYVKPSDYYMYTPRSGEPRTPYTCIDNYFAKELEGVGYDCVYDGLRKCYSCNQPYAQPDTHRDVQYRTTPSFLEE